MRGERWKGNKRRGRGPGPGLRVSRRVREAATYSRVTGGFCFDFYTLARFLPRGLDILEDRQAARGLGAEAWGAEGLSQRKGETGERGGLMW